jgi:hypothetical protein
MQGTLNRTSHQKLLTPAVFLRKVTQKINMKQTLRLAALVMAATYAASAQDVAGDWQGTLSANGAELRLVLHIAKNADDTLKATIDSVDQPGGNGIPVSSISLKDSKLSLGLAAVHATYEGNVAAGGKTISGTWTQGAALPLEFKRAAALVKPASPAQPSDIDGAWMGSLDTGAIKLRVVFHICNTGDGLKATMDSPDQGAMGIPVT